MCEGSVGVGSWSSWVSVGGLNRNRSLVLNVHGSWVSVGRLLSSGLLSLELELEEFDFLLLLEESEFGFLGREVVLLGLLLLVVLSVEDEPCEETTAEFDELRVAVVIAVALSFLRGPVASGAAVAA